MLSLVLNSDVTEFIQNNGKYGVAVIGIGCACNVLVQIASIAIENGYELNIQFGKDQNGITIGKPSAA